MKLNDAALRQKYNINASNNDIIIKKKKTITVNYLLLKVQYSFKS